jgi:hypothetical protein
MFRWLRRFFYSDDPDVKLVAGISEPEVEAWRELLANNGIPSMVKNMSYLSYDLGRAALPVPNNFDMWVRQSDFERAREVLAPFLEPNLPARPAGRRHVKVRRRPPSG